MFFPGGIYLFKGNDGSTRKMCEICSRLTNKTSKRRHCFFWMRRYYIQTYWEKGLLASDDILTSLWTKFFYIWCTNEKSCISLSRLRNFLASDQTNIISVLYIVNIFKLVVALLTCLFKSFIAILKCV